MSNFVNHFCCKWWRCHMPITLLRILEAVILPFSPRKQNSNVRFHNLAENAKMKHCSLFQLCKIWYHNLSCWLTSFLTGKVTIRLVALCAVLKNRGLQHCFNIFVSRTWCFTNWDVKSVALCALQCLRYVSRPHILGWLSFLCFLFSWPQYRVSQEFRSLFVERSARVKSLLTGKLVIITSSKRSIQILNLVRQLTIELATKSLSYLV